MNLFNVPNVPSMFWSFGFIVIVAILLSSILLLIRTLKLMKHLRSKSKVVFEIFDLNLENGHVLTSNGTQSAEQLQQQQQQPKNPIKADDHRWIRCCSTIDRNLDFFTREFPYNITECYQCKLKENFNPEISPDAPSSSSSSSSSSSFLKQNLHHEHSSTLKDGTKVLLEYIGISKTKVNVSKNLLQKTAEYFRTNPHDNVGRFLGIMIVNVNDWKKLEQNQCSGLSDETSPPRLDSKLLRTYSRNKIRLFPKHRIQENWINFERYYSVWQFADDHRILWDIIHGNVKLSWPIKLSFINDLIQGLKYLHECNLISGHGWINSRNCYMNNVWQVKIYSFQLNLEDTDHNPSNNNEKNHNNHPGKIIFPAEKPNILGLWMSPEQLRATNNNQKHVQHLQRADIYGFAMVCYEILCQKIPFDDFLNSDDDVPMVLDLIQNGLIYKTSAPNRIPEQLRKEQWPLRPKICQHLLEKRKYQCLFRLVEHCWNENPERRPDIQMIDQCFRNTFRSSGQNTIESLISKLNKCKNIIDERVRKRTARLEMEKKKSDQLLYRLLPVPVAKSMKNGEYVKPEQYDNVTILFSDIVGFTTIASFSEPLEIISILNNLFALFDKIVGKYDVYKVETIGDAYLAVSGLPNRNSNHAEQIAMVALEFLDCSNRFRIDHMPTIPLRIRVGIHSGSIVAGVVGITNPRFCIFGDSVNVASRLESTGYPNSIHISHTTEKSLQEYKDFKIQYRGTILLEGRGEHHTYWLLGREGFCSEIPVPANSNLNNNHGINNDAAFTSVGLFKQRL